MKNITLFLMVIILTSCAQSLSPRVSIINENKLQFSGKGAGAGMMLSAAMGSMGIAIGIAIDEGIAKDIRATAAKSDIVIEQILLASLKQRTPSFTGQSTVIYIDRFGFITWPGEGDAVMPQLHITVKDESNIERQIKFPEEFTAKGDAAPRGDFAKNVGKLEDIKKEGREIQRLLTYAADQLARKL